jgi:MYXO-CTERM domain-containing protein
MGTRPLFGAATLSLLLVAPAAAAAVTEPNGLPVPGPSSVSTETPLSTFFANRGESINALSDAHITPNVFSPRCGFTATYVLNQAGNHYGLAWYNDTGTQPQPADLHQLVPPNSTVGTTFSGTSILSDPAYTGGVIGFALIGGETHYTNASYDTTCTSCTPPGPWITALIYASTKTPNAYYVCFEDGPTSSTGWSNDGDFNDDVYFITGISCQGGGQPCDTGKPGICAAGLTQCSANGTTCQELNPPATSETCNGLDDDCNGQTDEGAPCPPGKVCDHGTCVASCQGGEFPCPAGLTCSSDGHCIDPKCVNVSCPAGQVCVAGTCKGPCDGITCPHPQVCRVGKCVDPCANVTCPSGQVCDQGVCVSSCACQPCGTGQTCESKSGQCIDPACSSVTCAAGTYCMAGNCVDDCAGAMCPSGQTCSAGKCIQDADAGTDAGNDGGGGITNPGDDGGDDEAPGPDAGSSDDAGSEDAGDGGTFGVHGSKSSCGCRSVGQGSSDNAMAVALFGLALAAVRRRARGGRR